MNNETNETNESTDITGMKKHEVFFDVYYNNTVSVYNKQITLEQLYEYLASNSYFLIDACGGAEAVLAAPVAMIQKIMLKDTNMTDDRNTVILERYLDGVAVYVSEVGDWYSRDDNSGVYKLDNNIIMRNRGVVETFYHVVELYIKAYTTAYKSLCGYGTDSGDNDKKEKEDRSTALTNIKALINLASKYATAADQVMNLPRIKSVTTMLSLSDKMSVSVNDIDVNPNLIGTENGVIDMTTLTFHSADNMCKEIITKQIACSYEPGAKCPHWKAFLEEIFMGDKDVIAFVQRLFGSALSGEKKTHLAILHGHGANGKTTLVSALTELLGRDYGKTTDITMLLQSNQQSKNEYYLAALKGARLVVMNESKSGGAMAENMVKIIVDGGDISARMPGGRPFMYRPSFLSVITTNDKPRLSDDYAIKRRIFMVPFSYTIPEKKRDRNFGNLLLEEKSGILNWMLEGFGMYEASGYSAPRTVMAATEEYFCEFDYMAQFIDDALIKMNGTEDKIYPTKFKHFTSAYKRWCIQNNVNPFGRARFKDGLQKHGVLIQRSPTLNQDCIYNYKLRYPNLDRDDEDEYEAMDIDKHDNVLMM